MCSCVTEFWQRYDRTLGGLEMQLRLRDFLGKKFNEMKKTSNDVFKNPRAMAKLFKEAGRLKNVLSANADHFAQVSEILCVLIRRLKLMLSTCRFHLNTKTYKNGVMIAFLQQFVFLMLSAQFIPVTRIIKLMDFIMICFITQWIKCSSSHFESELD